MSFQYQAGQVYFDSGVLGSTSSVPLQRITNVRITDSISRTNVMVLNRGKPLAQRPINNYIPSEMAVEYVKSDSSPEYIFGLANSTGIVTNLVNTNATNATYGIRNASVYFAKINSANFNGVINLSSGVLTNYSLQGTVGEPVRASVTYQFLDRNQATTTNARSTTDYNTSLVKPENVILNGINFTGLGITGMTVQSFSLGIGFTRNAIHNLGSRYPLERPITDVTATLQLQGYTEGFNNTLTGLGVYNNGDPIYGSFSMTLYPTGDTSSPTTYTFTNPYLETQEISSQVGGFTTASIGFSFPIGPNPLETGNGSVITIL